MVWKSHQLFDRTYIPAFANVALWVVLLLLIIFIVAPWHPLHHDVFVDTARTEHATPQANALRDDAMTVAVTRDARIFFGSYRVRAEELPGMVKEKLRAGAEGKIYLKVDARAKYIDVAAVLDAVRSTAIYQITFLTEQRR